MSPNPPPERAATQANACKKIKLIQSNVDEMGKPLLTPTEAKELARMEALNERLKLDRMLKENNDRVAQERAAETRKRLAEREVKP